MLCMIISECNQKAFKNTKRIASNYLEQYGRRTWFGNITYEGVQDMYHEMKSIGNKNTSVQCFAIKGGKIEKLWSIGNKNKMSESGQFVFSTTKKDYLSGEKTRTVYQRFSILITTISALVHDLGKINKTFQSKLIEDGDNSDYVRHEAISFEIFYNIIIFAHKKEKDNSGSKPLEIDIVRYLSDKENLKESFDHALNQPFFIETNNEIKYLKNLSSKYPILYNIMCLIINHHRLPGNIENEDGKNPLSFTPSYQTYYNHKSINKKQMNMEYDKNKYNFMLNEGSFLDSLSSRMIDLFHLMNDDIYNHLNIELMTIYNLYYNRLSLMMADRHFSSIKDKNSKQNKENFYANSQKDNNGKKIYAQTLEEHLIGVAKNANSNIRRIYNILEDDNLPSLEKGRIPPSLKISGSKKGDRFYWQDDMIKRVKQKHRDGIKDAGFFGNICAGTGTGKTRANAKLIASLSDNIRYTLGVGLRTLTLQTHTEYLQDVGLEKRDVAMLMGSDITRKLYEQNINIDQEIMGTSNKDEDDDYEQVISDDIDYIFDNGILSTLNPKDQLLVSKPIVVCTTDYIAKVSDMKRGRYIPSALRLITSDIILDEIDSYNNTDLVAIGKLVYRTGLSGRKVIISSATVGEAITIPLFNAYYEGYKRFCELMGKEFNLFSGWFSEYSDINKVSRIKSKDEYQKKNTLFIHSFIDSINNGIVRRKGEILDVSNVSSKHDVFHDIFKKCHDYHENHHSVSVDGIRISFGAVRFNTVRSCREFFINHLNFESDYMIKSMCYHSKNIPVILDIQERELNKILKRKDSNDIFKKPKVIEFIKEAKEKGKKDILIIVSTTSIEEVGRDHDFDYGITEPTLYRSMIQFAGRIKRHRYEEVTSPNFGIVSNIINDIENKRSNKLKSEEKILNSILENTIGSNRFNQHPERVWHDTSASHFNELVNEDFIRNINATKTLYTKNQCNDVLSHYEYFNRSFFLSKNDRRNGGDKYSLENYVENAFCGVTNEHYMKNIFRYSNRSIIFFKDEVDFSNKWYKHLERKEKDFVEISLQKTFFNDNFDRLFLKEDEIIDNIHEVIKNIGAENNGNMIKYLITLSIDIFGDNINKPVEYNVILGAIQVK